MKIKIVIVLIALIYISPIAIAELYHDQRPKYADDDFIKPKELMKMEQLEIFQILVIASMLTVNLIKVFGTFYALKMKDSTIKFNYNYLIAAVLGVFVGYSSYMQGDPVIDTTYISLFMESGFYALGANLLFDFVGNVKQKLSR